MGMPEESRTQTKFTPECSDACIIKGTCLQESEITSGSTWLRQGGFSCFCLSLSIRKVLAHMLDSEGIDDHVPVKYLQVSR